MFLRNTEFEYKIVDYFKYYCLRRQNCLCRSGVCAWITGMLFMCLLIMSLMIVKVSSAASLYQHRKSASLRANDIILHNDTLTDADATTLMLAAAHPTPHAAATAFTPPLLLPIKIPKHLKRKHSIIVRAIREEPSLRDEHAMRLQPLSLRHAMPGEAAYLLERADHAAHEQAIYGSWLTKAKRPQPPVVGAAESSAQASLGSPTMAAASLMPGDEGPDDIPEPHSHAHHYEQLAKRAATTTPMQSELRDQMPRPPHVASRQPSMLRRQLVRLDDRHDQIDREYAPPRPFHFPQDGPLPQEFQPKYPLRPEQERSELNNIQDILKQLQLGSTPTKPTPMVMMPTGLHVAGSFKNFKSSGIANFFRNKRHKKQLQLAVPMQIPLHWMAGHQAPLMPAFAPHQRIAMDQLYTYKPRSPNEINLLAMHQQLKSSGHSKSKKKRKQPWAALASPQLLLPPHSDQRPLATNPFFPSYPQYMFALNQSQRSKPKRMPFKLNLDIYPVATPTQDYKASAFTLDEAKVPTTARPVTALRNPFVFPDSAFPPAPASINHVGARDNLMHLPPFGGKWPAVEPQPQPSSSLVSFNTHSNPFYPNPSQLPFTLANQQSNLVDPADSQSDAAAAANANQLLLHLNVFPKHSATSAPTNPFYGNVGGINNNNNNGPINRQSTVEQQQQSEPHLLTTPKLKPRCKNANRTASMNQQQPKLARSDNLDSSVQPLVDFEHPIVAADVPSLMQQPHVDIAAHTQENSRAADAYVPLETRPNFRYLNTSASADQMIAEARAASLFRFPVEDLIQFQVDDAL